MCGRARGLESEIQWFVFICVANAIVVFNFPHLHFSLDTCSMPLCVRDMRQKNFNTKLTMRYEKVKYFATIRRLCAIQFGIVQQEANSSHTAKCFGVVYKHKQKYKRTHHTIHCFSNVVRAHTTLNAHTKKSKKIHSEENNRIYWVYAMHMSCRKIATTRTHSHTHFTTHRILQMNI